MATDITPIPTDKEMIHSYGLSGFIINGNLYPRSCLVTPHGVLTLEDAALSVEYLMTRDWTEWELVLVGTGSKHRMLSITGNFEFMTTGAACRTYNIVVAEGRNACALLFPLTVE